jgi:hypothetical protein
VPGAAADAQGTSPEERASRPVGRRESIVPDDVERVTRSVCGKGSENPLVVFVRAGV